MAAINRHFFRWILASWILSIPSVGFSQILDSNPKQEIAWQGTLADINSRVQTLLQENDLLMKEYEANKLELNDIQYKVNEQKRRNIEELDRSRSLQMPDVQERAKELRAQIKEKQKQFAERQKEVATLEKKIVVLEQKVEAKNAKFQAQQERERVAREQAVLRIQAQSDRQKERLAQKEAALGEEIAQLKARLEEHKGQEAAVSQQIEELRGAIPNESPEDTAGLQSDNADLQNQIDQLQKDKREKLEKQRRAPRVAQKDSVIQQKKEYLLALKEKTAIESQIVNLETQLKIVQGGADSNVALSSDIKRDTVTDIMNIEKSNDALREQIVNLKENVYILKDKISRIEDRARTKDTINERKKILEKYKINTKRRK